MTKALVESTDRIQYFDGVKLFAMFLVLYGHCIQYLITKDVYHNEIWLFIYSFHMPLFMIVAGFFSRRSLSLSFNEFFVKKFKQLLLPCVIWELVIIITRYAIDGAVEWSVVIKNDLWFLKSLFLCFLAVWPAFHFKKKFLVVSWIIITLLFSQIVYNFRIIDMYPCFVLGIGLRYVWSTLSNKSLTTIAVLCLALYIFFSLLYLTPDYYVYPSLRNEPIGYAMKSFSHFAMGGGISIFIMFLFKGLQSFLPDIICIIGKKTLGIYLCQSVILETLIPNWLSLKGTNPFIAYGFFVPMVCITVLIVSLFLINLIEKKRVLRTLFLGKE